MSPLLGESAMERERHHAEDAKDENLKNEAADDDVLTRVLAAGRVGLDQNACATTLNHETDNVARDENRGDSFQTQNEILLAIKGTNHATECHV